MDTQAITNDNVDEPVKPDTSDIAAVIAANAAVNGTAVTDKIAQYESLLAEAEALKPVVAKTLEEAIASNQAKLDKLNGKKARVAKDGAEDREPSKAVIEDYFGNPSKLDKNGHIRVRDWKTTMRPAVIKFAKEDPGYEVVVRGPHQFVKRATQSQAVNPESGVVTTQVPAE